MKQAKLWHRYPSFRLFLFLVTGVLLANFTKVNFWPTVSVFGIASLLMFSSCFKKSWFYNHRKRPLFGVIVAFLFLSLGVILTHLYSEKLSFSHYASKKTTHAYYEVEVLETPLLKSRSYKCVSRLTKVQNDSGTFELKGKLLIYFEKDSLVKSLNIGDVLAFKGTLNSLKVPMNPEEFDYKNYLNLQSVYGQTYLRKGSWKLIKKGSDLSILRYSSILRQKLLARIDGWEIGSDEKAITKALLFGYRYEIDSSLLSAYSSAGATHVLAVSGLHVGVIYLLTSYLLSFFNLFNKGRMIKPFFMLGLLWGYALVTGLSPSVVRAVTMFSFVAVGTGFKRNVSIYNTLLISALFLLIIKPTYLFEVGFQLSYTAVFFIVWLQSRFESILKPKNWILKKVWLITTVSLAAQIGTFPLGLYYFHQFPSLFLLSNLVVIPLISILMYLGLGILLLSVAGISLSFLTHLYEFLLGIMNKSVRLIESVPGLLIEQIHLSRIELVLFYVLIFLSFSWLFYGKRGRLIYCMITALLLLSLNGFKKYSLEKKKEIWIYSIPNHFAIGQKSGDHFTLIGDAALLENEGTLNFHINHHLWSQNVTDLNILDSDTNYCERDICMFKNFISIEGIEFWKYSSDTKVFPENTNWLVDSRKQFPPKLLNNGCIPRRIIIGKETSFSHSESWSNWASKNQIELINVLRTGAFQLTNR